MKTCLQSIVVFALTLCGSISSFAQDVVASADTNAPSTAAGTSEGEKKEEEDKPKLTFSGSVDTYFHTTFGKTWAGSKAPGTSFANQPGFGLGMANLIASYGEDKVGFTADLVFGPRGKEAVFGDRATSQGIVNQLFVYYKPTDKITLTLGQFNTFLGYEVISPTLNFHYSTSYMFSWGPFNHTGLRADFDLGGGLIAKAAILNPTDLVEFNPVNTYTYGVQLGYTNEKGGIWFNTLIGDQDGTLDVEDGLTTGQFSEGNTMQFDITTGWNLTEKFYIGFNTTYRGVAKGEVFDGTEIHTADEDVKGFYGAAIYPKVTLSESFAIGLRAEYFKIEKGYLSNDSGPFAFARGANGSGGVKAFTLSANYKVGGLTFIPELRADIADEDSYEAKGEAGLSKQMMSCNIAAVYKF